MTAQPTLWMRHESRFRERRAPLTPADAAALVADGMRVVVEESPARVFTDEEYEAAGCLIAPAESWPDAPEGAIVLGLKELPPGETPLRDHIFFGEAFDSEKGSDRLLRRFSTGGGTLYDLETLVDADGRRLASFSYWGGYLSAALAVFEARREMPRALRPTDRAGLDDALATGAGDGLRAVVTGAKGRSGRGACDALAVAGVATTRWDVEETRDIDTAALLGHDILVNAARPTGPCRPFLVGDDLDRPDRRLSVISEALPTVSRRYGLVPLYHELTTCDSPVRELRGGSRPARLIAVDNLVTLLPREASTDYSAELRPLLATLPDGHVWQRAREEFWRHAPSLLAV